jgi:hypothetical protein
LFMRRFSKINSMWKDVKSHVSSTLYIVDNYSKIIHTLVGGSQWAKNKWCGYIINALFKLTLLFIYRFCMICIHIIYILLVGCNSSMTEGWIHPWIDECIQMDGWMSLIHFWITFFYTIHLYYNRHCV